MSTRVSQIQGKPELTVLAAFQHSFRKFIMGVVRRPNDNQFDLRISQYVVKRSVDFRGHPESFLYFAAASSWVSLEYRVEGEQVWEAEDKGYMESKASQTDPKNASTDRPRSHGDR